MANKLPNATAGMTFPRPKPDTPPSMVKKIGKTTYPRNLKRIESASEFNKFLTGFVLFREKEGYPVPG